jgi:hypothetical protein
MMRITQLGIIFLAGLLTFSCQLDNCEQLVHSFEYQTIYTTESELRSSIEFQEARDLVVPGKIYFYNNLLLVNELYEGIHFFDNTDPSDPKKLSFLKILGNTDFAIKGGKLYANNQVDLLTFNINDINNIQLEDIAENTFKEFYDEPSWAVSTNFYLCTKPVKKTEFVSCNDYEGRKKNGLIRELNFGNNDIAVLESSLMTMESAAAFSSDASSGNSGTSGSMASFIIRGNYLYTIDPNKIYTFELDQENDPVLVSEEYIGWGLETIFAHEEHLFLGSSNGMYILSLEDPSAPSYLSSIGHVGACDPVFVKDDYAYVTLRSGNACDGFTNQMDLVDISSKTNPVLVKSFNMTNPHGLSISNNELYLCDGPDGLKVFDINQPENLNRNLIGHHPNKFAFDVIALPQLNNLLIMIGAQGLVQYDFSDPENLVELSSINIDW